MDLIDLNNIPGENQSNKKITDEERDLIHNALKQVHSQCDGAIDLDYVGFNQADASIGASLAKKGELFIWEAAIGKKILRKYHKQISAQTYEAIYGKPKQPKCKKRQKKVKDEWI